MPQSKISKMSSCHANLCFSRSQPSRPKFDIGPSWKHTNKEFKKCENDKNIVNGSGKKIMDRPVFSFLTMMMYSCERTPCANARPKIHDTTIFWILIIVTSAETGRCFTTLWENGIVLFHYLLSIKTIFRSWLPPDQMIHTYGTRCLIFVPEYLFGVASRSIISECGAYNCFWERKV